MHHQFYPCTTTNTGMACMHESTHHSNQKTNINTLSFSLLFPFPPRPITEGSSMPTTKATPLVATYSTDEEEQPSSPRFFSRFSLARSWRLPTFLSALPCLPTLSLPRLRNPTAAITFSEGVATPQGWFSSFSLPRLPSFRLPTFRSPSCLRELPHLPTPTFGTNNSTAWTFPRLPRVTIPNFQRPTFSFMSRSSGGLFTKKANGSECESPSPTIFTRFRTTTTTKKVIGVWFSFPWMHIWLRP